MDVKLIKVIPKDEVHVIIDADLDIIKELVDYFAIEAVSISRNHKKLNYYDPSGKRGWDGKTRFFEEKKQELPKGLLHRVIDFCQERKYRLSIDPSLLPQDTVDVDLFCASLGLIYNPHDFQNKAFERCVHSGRRLVLSPTSCHAKDDKIIMSDGSIKNIQDIVVGDSVVGIDCTPKKVIRTYTGQDDLYEIKPKNNRKKSITVTKNHLLCLRFTNERKNSTEHNKRIEFISVEDYLQKSYWFKHNSKLFYNDKPIEWQNIPQLDCLLSPYFIGLCLGDDHIDLCDITTIEKNQILTEFEKIGLTFGKNRTKCEDKFIPEILLKQSVDFRTELLSGLIDSKGHLSHNLHYDFTLKSEKLVLDIMRLATSLGLVTKKTTKIINNATYHRCSISGNIEILNYRLKRKSNIAHKNRNLYFTGFDVIPRGKGNYYGIQVEDSLYLTEEGMVTHNSGKSLLLFMLTMFYLRKTRQKILIVVPYLGLLKQLEKEFKEYSRVVKLDDHIHLIGEGSPLDDNSKKIYIASYQSIVNQPLKYYDQFGCIIVDEVHRSYNQIKKILNSAKKTKYKFGVTATLDGSKLHLWKTESITGKSYTTTKTNILIKRGIVSKLNILCFMFKYGEKFNKDIAQIRSLKPSKKNDFSFYYKQQIEYIMRLPERNQKIRDIVLNTPNKKNTLIITDRLEHIEILSNYFKNTNKKVILVTGKMAAEDREKMRSFTEKNENVVIIGTSGTMSTAISIKNLQNVICVMPFKSQIKLLQTIGRGLRLDGKDNKLNFIDIIDDFEIVNNKKNYFIEQFRDRLRVYSKEEFEYKVFNINI